ncbi:hypothetical protein ZIOFF_065993 [Zingiber officinale]|uniref:Large ribosomal subunit protein uL6 alpha-beta domain-containing protein n=1 Tax=Zingiber officinale TaxID=94328 RepID=A0A8J5KBU3_ZINOF|nr:hypothetical protein ZIOFF_065993 [Zingiber officinale]
MPRFPKRPHPYPLSPSLLLSLPSLPSCGLLHLLGFLLLMLSGFFLDSSAAFSPEIVLIPLLFSLLVLGFGSSGLLLRRLHSWRLSSNAEGFSTRSFSSQRRIVRQPAKMKTILSSQTMDIPKGVTVKVNAKIVEVEGPRGKLTRDFKHLNLDFELIEGGKKLKVDAWFGSRKTTAAIRTSLSHIDNLITGVTKPILFLVVLFLVPFVAAIKTSRLAPLGLRAMAAYSAAAASPSRLLLRQLFEKESSTYTYLLADLAHPDKPAVVTPFLEPSLLVDPVDKIVDRDTNLVKELGLKLIYAMNTHVHADHVTGTGLIKKKMPGVKSVISKASTAQADHLVDHADKIYFGDLFLEVFWCSVDMADLKWQFFALPVTLAISYSVRACAFPFRSICYQTALKSPETITEFCRQEGSCLLAAFLAAVVGSRNHRK